MNSRDDICQISIINEKKVNSVKQNLLDQETYLTLSETFKALGSETRVKILHTLSEEELCVCDISAILGMSISAISHQLRVLRNIKVVKHRKEGKMVYYSLDDDHITKLLGVALEHITEE